MILRPTWTNTLFNYEVSNATGNTEAYGHFINTVSAFELDRYSLVLTGTGYKAGSLYYPDLRSQLHRAFVNRVVADGGTVEDDMHTGLTITALKQGGMSLACSCSAYKAEKLYSFIPNSVTTVSNGINISLGFSDTTSNYRISDVPDFSAEYPQPDVRDLVDIEYYNKRSAYTAKLYRANGYRNNFSFISNITLNTYQDVFGAPSDVAYKYKSSYFITGNVNSVLTTFEGTRSPAVYLTGDL